MYVIYERYLYDKQLNIVILGIIMRSNIVKRSTDLLHFVHSASLFQSRSVWIHIITDKL